MLVRTVHYQRIAIGDHVVVEGHDRSYLDQIIFADGIAGKSLLDIGSQYGYFCLEALRRGARRAVGIEAYRETIEFARHIAAESGMTPEYIETDFEEWESDEKFDIILCLNVLHHLFDPIHSLRRMIGMARDKIVLEIAPPRFNEVLRGRMGLLTALCATQPIIAMGTPKSGTAVAKQSFMFSRAALEMFFDRHNAAFEPVRIIKSPFKGRFIVEAKKRKIETLTIIAGPTAAGKSTFMERLVADADLRRSLSIPDEVTAALSAHNFRKLPSGPLRHVVLHYDMLRPFSSSLRSFARDPLAGLFREAREIHFFTLMTPQERLRDQLKRSDIDSGKGTAKHRKLYQLYSTPDFLRLWYDSWFAHCAAYPSVKQRVIVENQGDYRYFTDDRWRDLFDAHFKSV